MNERRWYLGANRSGKTWTLFALLIAEAWPSLSWWQKMRLRWMMWHRGMR